MTDRHESTGADRRRQNPALVALAFGVGVGLAVGNAANSLVVGAIVGVTLAAALGRYLAQQGDGRG